MVLNRRDLPWTVSLSLPWTVVLAVVAFCSGGILFLVLGLYLAYWVRTRRGRSVAFVCYLLVVGISILLLLFTKIIPASYGDVIGIAGCVLWLIAVLALRAEIITREYQTDQPSHKLPRPLRALPSNNFNN